MAQYSWGEFSIITQIINIDLEPTGENEDDEPEEPEELEDDVEFDWDDEQDIETKSQKPDKEKVIRKTEKEPKSKRKSKVDSKEHRNRKGDKKVKESKVSKESKKSKKDREAEKDKPTEESKTGKKSEDLKHGNKHKKGKKRPKAKKESAAWKKQEKRFKRTKNKIKAIGAFILVLIILATIVGYVYFFQIDTDGDGIPDASDSDDDNDDIPDAWEEKYGLNPRDPSDAIKDEDGDGLNNRNEYNFQSDPTDIDTDDDGLTDLDEWKAVREIFGKSSNPNSPDTDRDGMPDGWEYDFGLNPIDDDGELDMDEDGYDANQNGKLEEHEFYTNLDEYINKTDPKDADTDDDGMWDGWEIYFLNECNRLRLRFKNYNPEGNRDYNFTMDPLDPSDANQDIDVETRNNVLYITPDGLINLEEFKFGSNPTKPDSDRDNITDFDEIETYNTDPLYWDSDYDGLWDGWEVKFGGKNAGLDPSSNDTDSDGELDGDEDLDNDGLQNKLEHLPTIGTSPVKWDTDGDRMPDGWEVTNKRNPRMIDAEFDPDFDSLSNIAEFENDTLPDNPDTDSDGLLDGEELVTGFPGIIIDGVYTASPKFKYQTSATNNDTDSDGILDGEEVKKGSDGYITNATNSDSDGDGIADLEELIIGIDGFITNPTNEDTDNDRLTDKQEIENAFGYSTLPTKGDTDEDGLKDGDEVLTDFLPFKAGLDNTDPTKRDTDGDGMEDGWEWEFGYVARNDTIIKTYDLRYGTNFLVQLQKNVSVLGFWLVNPVNPNDKDEDPDFDGYDGDWNKKIDKNDEYTNYEEYGNKTNPMLWDTDRDKMSDGWEIWYYDITTGRPNPLEFDADVDEDKGGSDGVEYWINNKRYFDNFTNIEEFQSGIDLNGDGIIDHGSTNPNLRNSDRIGLDDYEEIWYADSDGDGLPDGWELIFNGSTPWDPDGFVPHKIMPGKFNPFNNDSDNNGTPDNLEDYDSDGEINEVELAYPGTDPGSSDPTNGSKTQASIPFERSIESNRHVKTSTRNNQNKISSIGYSDIHPQNIYQNYLISTINNNIKLQHEFRTNYIYDSSSGMNMNKNVCVCSGGTRIWG